MGRSTNVITKAAVNINYAAVPTAVYFHRSNAFVRGILGPVGSGKSVACCFEMFARAMREPAGPDGYRKSRWLVARSSFPELKTTTIKTFLEWFGDVGEITYDSPIRYLSTLPLGDGTSLYWEVWFKPVDGTQDSLDGLRSLEITGAWLNEAHEFPPNVYDILRTRVGRYKPYQEVGVNFRGIILDSNYGNTTSPLRTYLEAPPEGWEFYEQPPAVIWDNQKSKWEVNHSAENLGNLDDGLGYYARSLSGMQEHNIKQLLACQWGNPRSDKPVFPEFNSRTHVFRGRIAGQRTLPLWIGLDFGLHAAAVIGQMTPQGSLVILDEIWNDDASLEDFLKLQVLPMLATRYRGYNVFVCADPAGRGRSAIDKRSSFDVLRQAGLAAMPSPTNDPVVRRDSLRAFMVRTNGFLVNPQCKRLIEGLSGGFGYKRRPDNTFMETAMKNLFSHVCEAAEYLAVFARLPAHNHTQARTVAAPQRGYFYG